MSLFASYTRDQLRQTYTEAWKKHLQRSPLSPLEALIVDVLELHPEYQRIVERLDDALELERTRTGGLSEAKLGGRFKVHGRVDEPCPASCGDTLCRVSFESYEMIYCPSCQTGGRQLKDRRLSRLLK